MGKLKIFFLWAFIFVATFRFPSLLLIGSWEPELEVKTRSAGFAPAAGPAPRPLPAPARAAARPPRTLSAPTPPRWRVRADLPARSRAPRGAGTREQIAAGARGSFAFLWRAHNSGGLACGGLQEGQSRLSLHSDTVHLPHGGAGRAPPRVGVAGLPGAWGSGHVPLLLPWVCVPCTGALTRGPSVCNSDVLAAPCPGPRAGAAQSAQPGALRGDPGLLSPSMKSAAPNPFPGAPSTGCPETLGPPRPHRHGRLGCWPRALRSPRGPGGSADPTPAARSWKPEEGLQNLPGKEVRTALAEAEPVLFTLFCNVRIT